jgi:GTP-binding protein EngB required for normal cell division
MALQPIDGLREELAQIQKALIETRMLPFSPETQHSFLTSAQQLEDRLDRLTRDQLTVGLLGGTGVGKSTLMNALGGAPIAATDHRRPHTDRVLIYHCAGDPLPATITQSNVARQEITHDAHDIRHIVLCDLPDFDSLLTQNRDLVLEFVEHLDLLIWVSSPEKYADARFYEFLALVPKAKQNFLFVLNKMDLLFPSDTRPPSGELAVPPGGQDAVSTELAHEPAGARAFPPGAKDAASGYVSLEQLLNRFRDHIVRHGIEHPLIYAVSAEQVVAGLAPTPWNQFAAFRHHLFQQRAVKEIVAIKAANLDEEIQRLMDTVRGELQALARAIPVVQRLVAELSQEAVESIAAGRLALDRWIRQDVYQELERVTAAPSLLVGPGRALEALRQGWDGWRRNQHSGARQAQGESPTAASPFSEDLVQRLRGELEHMEHRLANSFLRQAFSAGLTETLVQAMGLQEAWEQFSVRVRNAVESRLLVPAEPRHSWPIVLFRCRQYLAYAALVAVFLVVEGGEGLWVRLVQQPSLRTLVTVVLSIFNSLFSPSGLAALASLAVLLLLLAARFLRRYKKLLQQQNQKIIDSLKKEAGSYWEDLIRQVIENLTRFQHDLQQPVEAFSQMRREPTGE